MAEETITLTKEEYNQLKLKEKLFNKGLGRCDLPDCNEFAFHEFRLSKNTKYKYYKSQREAGKFQLCKKHTYECLGLEVVK